MEPQSVYSALGKTRDEPFTAACGILILQNIAVVGAIRKDKPTAETRIFIALRRTGAHLRGDRCKFLQKLKTRHLGLIRDFHPLALQRLAQRQTLRATGLFKLLGIDDFRRKRLGVAEL